MDERDREQDKQKRKGDPKEVLEDRRGGGHQFQAEDRVSWREGGRGLLLQHPFMETGEWKLERQTDRQTDRQTHDNPSINKLVNKVWGNQTQPSLVSV